MTKEELDVIERSIALVVMCSGGVVVFIKMFDWLKQRDKENSVGASKIGELLEANAKLQKSIEDLQKSDAKQNETLIELKSDTKQIMSLVLNWFKGNK